MGEIAENICSSSTTMAHGNMLSMRSGGCSTTRRGLQSASPLAHCCRATARTLQIWRRISSRSLIRPEKIRRLPESSCTSIDGRLPLGRTADIASNLTLAVMARIPATHGQAPSNISDAGRWKRASCASRGDAQVALARPSTVPTLAPFLRGTYSSDTQQVHVGSFASPPAEGIRSQVAMALSPERSQTSGAHARRAWHSSARSAPPQSDPAGLSSRARHAASDPTCVSAIGSGLASPRSSLIKGSPEDADPVQCVALRPPLPTSPVARSSIGVAVRLTTSTTLRTVNVRCPRRMATSRSTPAGKAAAGRLMTAGESAAAADERPDKGKASTEHIPSVIGASSIAGAECMPPIDTGVSIATERPRLPNEAWMGR
eukprot:scaffold544_cov117-Isochrysis_galbana.AAC.19